ncbi:MAG: gfo/Idh/MocA family oxidoreductase, partial [Eubacteriales bacterium]
GTLTVRDSDGNVETFHDEPVKTGAKAYWGTSHGALIEDFYDCILEDKPFAVSAEEAKKVLGIIDAVYKG